MDIKQLKYVYFLGIGGIGMSALARYFNHHGYEVAGYDKTATSLTAELIEEGIDIHFIEDFNLIPAPFRENTSELMVIYTPAVPKNNAEVRYFNNQGIKIWKRAEVLGRLSSINESIAVAGTHGKTSVSTMITTIFKYSSLNCTAFLGGISKDYHSNLVLSDESDFTIVEADEYDRSFLHLQPSIAVITAIDADHLDVYGNREELKKSFLEFISRIKPGGYLIMKQGLDIEIPASLDIHACTYGFDKKSDYRASNISSANGKQKFNLEFKDKKYKNLEIGLPGKVNIENALAAIGVADTCGIEEEAIAKAVKAFSGVKRRFDFQINNDNIVYIDDYAHHPEELKAFIGSVRELYPGREIKGIFQPHLFSRTRDFASEFAESLDLLDSLILLDIYPAREEPIPGITSEIIFEKVTIENKTSCTKEELLDILKKSKIDVLLTMGAGDIDRMVVPVNHLLKARETNKSV
jgi:UDP-N-acetylmuramate--alanine ligase